MEKTIPAFIQELSKIEDLRQVMANAKTQSRPDVYWAAFNRLCEIQGMNYEDPLEKDFFCVLSAYEELLTEKNGKTTKANRTKQKLLRHGLHKCLEDWALSSTPTPGFILLMENGMQQLTAEYLVVKYADRFSENVVRAAQKRLGEAA